VTTPFEILNRELQDAVLKYAEAVGPFREAETEIEVSVQHTPTEILISRVEARTRLSEPTILRLGGRR